MGQQRVGTCSLCGGDVIGTRGAYWSVLPPPPDMCSRCLAVAQSDVIPMVRPSWEKPVNTNRHPCWINLRMDTTVPEGTIEVWQGDRRAGGDAIGRYHDV